MLKRILVANRGEIAVRVIRACHELGLEAVAVYWDADRDALHVLDADLAYHLGPASPALSYLNVDRLIALAQEAACDGVHPGYGFLAENAAFARRCGDARLVFIGPKPPVIEQMGDKIAARRCAAAAGFPIVPGTTEPIVDAVHARALAQTFGYPIAIKAAAGGGGKGLKVAYGADDVDGAVSIAAKEASLYFKDGTLYVERYLRRPKHVEVQVLGDKHGHVVQLGERDCSLQRRHQKLIEEAPSPGMTPKLREEMGRASVAGAKASFEFVAAPPVGVGMIVAILSDKPLQIVDLPDVPTALAGQSGAADFVRENARALTIVSADIGGQIKVPKWSIATAFYGIH